jgi:hypothetical protein
MLIKSKPNFIAKFKKIRGSNRRAKVNKRIRKDWERRQKLKFPIHHLTSQFSCSKITDLVSLLL